MSGGRTPSHVTAAEHFLYGDILYDNDMSAKYAILTTIAPEQMQPWFEVHTYIMAAWRPPGR